MSEYERTLDYELELIRLVEGSPQKEEPSPDVELLRLMNELIATMEPEHAEVVRADLQKLEQNEHSMVCLLTCSFIHRAIRRRYGDERPFILPGSVAGYYLEAERIKEPISERDCRCCGYDSPYSVCMPQRMPDYVSCPLCGGSLDKHMAEQSWQRANAERVVNADYFGTTMFRVSRGPRWPDHQG